MLHIMGQAGQQTKHELILLNHGLDSLGASKGVERHKHSEPMGEIVKRQDMIVTANLDNNRLDRFLLELSQRGSGGQTRQDH